MIKPIKQFSKNKVFIVPSLAVLVFVLMMAASGCGKPAERYQKVYLDAFDTVITVAGYAETQENFDKAAELVHQEMLRYHKLYDIYNEYSGINNIKTVNKNAGISPIKVDDDIISLLTFSKDMWKVTEGKVNVAMGSVLKIWHDERNHGINYPEKAKLPDMAKLQAANLHTDFENVIIDTEKKTVFIEDSGMSLDVGAIAKGYATEKVTEKLREEGYDNIVLNIGGNISTIGTKPKGELWNVGIQNPDLNAETAHIETVSIKDLSLATSGVYQRFYEVDGKRYHHIIDQNTLMPENRYLSVSVLTEDAGLADAMSTALFNTDFEEGKKFAEKFKENSGCKDIKTFEVMWVMPDNEVRYTDGFKNVQ